MAAFSAYPTADAPAHGRGYMVKGDGFGVVAVRPGWVEAEFEGPNCSTWGSVKAADLYPGSRRASPANE